MQRKLNGSEQVEVLLLLDILNQLYKHLGIGIRSELHPLLNELALKRSIILNDSIMDDGQIHGLRIMWMGVLR